MSSHHLRVTDTAAHVAKGGGEQVAQFRISGRMAQPIAQTQDLPPQMNAAQRIGNLSFHDLRLRSEQRTELGRAVLLAPLPYFSIHPFSSEGAKRIIADGKTQTLGVTRQIARQ